MFHKIKTDVFTYILIQLSLLKEQEDIIHCELSKITPSSPTTTTTTTTVEPTKNQQLKKRISSDRNCTATVTNDLVKMMEGDENPFVPHQEIFNKFSFMVSCCFFSLNHIYYI